MGYYKHVDKSDVICELLNSTLRFGKWKWTGNSCEEVYKYKDLTDDFYKSFIKISQKEYNNIWGIKLENA